jgi:hypothetical protein
MSSTDVSKYDPEYSEQQDTVEPPAPTDPNKCLTEADLQKKLNTGDFNKQLSNVISDATGFLNSYIKDQNNIKNNTAEKKNALENDRLWQTAINKQRELLDKHKRVMQMLNREYETTEQVGNSLENTKDLLKMLTKQNMKLKKIIEGEVHSIELSDRMTYYENEQNNWIDWWAHHFKTKYWLLIFLLIVGIFLTKRQNEKQLWGKVGALAIYPYIAFFIIRLIKGMYNWIISDTKWVYLRANM